MKTSLVSDTFVYDRTLPVSAVPAPPDTQATGLIRRLKKKGSISGFFLNDAAFDWLYPEDLQRISLKHWTPLTVARAAAAYLAVPGSRILDIGSGTGKFCLTAAELYPQCHFFGAEQREELVDYAERALSYLGLQNAAFLHTNITQLNFNRFDHFYFYNAFYENIDQENAVDEKMNRAKPKKEKGEVWQKLLSLKPMSAEKELLIDHEYDGIQELDNPTPAWFMYLFYVTIAFAVGYIMIYHVFGVGELQYAEYKTEMAQAEIEKKIYLSKAANLVDENSVKIENDAGMLAEGKTVFKASCSPCHGENAQGLVGPNLTDEYWLHGGKINDIFKTIKYGVQAKGMPTWEKSLTPKQIANVANYILTLQGLHPAGAKEPQGEKEGAEKLASK